MNCKVLEDYSRLLRCQKLLWSHEFAFAVSVIVTENRKLEGLKSADMQVTDKNSLLISRMLSTQHI